MLAAREGLVPQATAERAWTLWPLLLVGVGLSIALAGRPGATLGGLVVAVTLGSILGGIAATGFAGGFGGCGGDRDGSPFAEESGSIAPGAHVSVAISCGELDLGTVAGTTWSVSGSSPQGGPPEISTDAGGLTIRNPDRGPFAFDAATNHWTVVVPRDPGFDLDVATNGGSSRVVLEAANVRDASFTTNAGALMVDLRAIAALSNLEVHTNLGSTIVRLPQLSAAGSFAVNAGSLSICTPAGAGLRIELHTVAGGSDLGDHGLVESGGVWETPGFDTAAIRLDLDVDVNAGSLKLDPGSDCAG
jgi:hypothetical protein